MLNVLVVSLLWVAYANGNPSDDSEVAGPVVVLPRSPSPTAGNHTGEEHPTPSDPTLKSLVKEVAREVDTALLKVNRITRNHPHVDSTFMLGFQIEPAQWQAK